MRISAEVRNDLDVVAKANDGNTILWAGRLQKIARCLADKINVFLDAAGNVQQQDEIEWLTCRRDLFYFALDAVFINGKVGFLHAANSAPIAIRDAGVETH